MDFHERERGGRKVREKYQEVEMTFDGDHFPNAGKMVKVACRGVTWDLYSEKGDS